MAIIKRYLTSRPKLEAFIELLKICGRIPTTTQTRFTDTLYQQHENHKDFINDIVPLECKKLIKLHQGLAKKRKVPVLELVRGKLVDEFLDNYNKK